MQRFGGRLEYAMTGGASLHKDIQTFFADIGIPVMEVRHSELLAKAMSHSKSQYPLRPYRRAMALQKRAP